jgi:hypothetical protein
LLVGQDERPHRDDNDDDNDDDDDNSNRQEGTLVCSLDGKMASACRGWMRAPEDRLRGLILFRSVVAFSAGSLDTPCGPYWTRLIEDMQNALA